MQIGENINNYGNETFFKCLEINCLALYSVIAKIIKKSCIIKGFE